MTAKRLLTILACCLLLVGCSISPGICAEKSKLDKFERDANKPAPKPDADDSDHHDDWDDDDDNDWRFATARILGHMIGTAGKLSWYRVADPGRCRAMGYEPRHVGEATLPFFRLDMISRSVDHDIDAVDLRSEIGFGPLAVQFNELRYREYHPSDSLTISEYYGLYRFSLGSSAEVDFGLGSLSLRGNSATTRASFTLPILYHPTDARWGVEFRPAWASGISDYDFAMLYSGQYSSLKVGYRWVASPSYSLSGPYVGFSVRL